MGTIETAQGKFSNAWVAVYRDVGNIMYYGYGNTRDEAKAELMRKIPMEEIATAYDEVSIRETYRQHATGS